MHAYLGRRSDTHVPCIAYALPSQSVTPLVQMGGRARAANAQYLLLATSLKEEEGLHDLIR